MKSLTVTLFVVGMFLATPALADDVEDVKAAVHEFYVLLNSTDAADAEAYAQLYAAENTIFTAGGGLLGRTTSLEGRKESFERRIGSGLRNNYNQPRHSEVEVYGNMFAVETSYTTGSSISPGGHGHTAPKPGHAHLDEAGWSMEDRSSALFTHAALAAWGVSKIVH
jgi:hypothetical protein